MKGEKKLESMEGVKSRVQTSCSILDLNGKQISDSGNFKKNKITELISDSRRVTPGSAFLLFRDSTQTVMIMLRKHWIVVHLP